MTRRRNGLARRTIAIASCAALTVALSPARPATLDQSHAGFCAEVQRRLVGTALPIENVVETGFDPFKLSKPAVRPLRTHQYLASGEDGRALQLSCKTKTADHLRSAHGAGALSRQPPDRPDRACRDLHRDMIREIWRSLSADERRSAPFPPSRVMLEPDALSYTGSGWVRSRANAWRGPDDMLHLRSAALFAAWEDWRWKVMPDTWRGNHYCHLVAPERLRQLMLGTERLTTGDPG
jgi:hypothetical protein